MNKVVELYKPIGKTPLEALEKYRKEHPKLINVKMAYAGRLDPMAHGMLKILIGDACKERDKYQALNKTYKFQVLFGVTTDTFDLMGIPSLKSIFKFDSEQAKKVIKTFEGRNIQNYPVFSSMHVEGKPLFWWAKEKRLNEITIPRKEVEIFSIKVNKKGKILGKEILEKAKKNIPRVKGDFRQDEILKKWEEVLKEKNDFSFPLFYIEANVTSGTYVRAIANEIGEKVGTGAIAFDIERVGFD